MYFNKKRSESFFFLFLTVVKFEIIGIIRKKYNGKTKEENEW